MEKTLQKVLAVFLATVLLIGILPTYTAFAVDEGSIHISEHENDIIDIDAVTSFQSNPDSSVSTTQSVLENRH